MSQSTAFAVSGNTRCGGPKSQTAFPGIHFHKASGKWAAMVSLVGGKRKHVGLGATPQEAAALREAFIAAHGVSAPNATRGRKPKAATVTTGEVSA